MSDQPKPATPPTGVTAAEAEILVEMAAQKRGMTHMLGGDTFWRAQLQAEAEGLEALALTLRNPAQQGMPPLFRGLGGEVAPRDDPDMAGHTREIAQAVTGSTAMLAADASLARLRMARDAGALTLAVEVAKDAGAQTAVEKMLSHQLAAAHQLAMSLLTAAQGDTRRYRDAPHLNTGAPVEAARNTHAAARLMDAFSRAALALDRLRNGSRQTVVVQHHTEVHAGGKAVVAGTVNTKPEGNSPW